MRATAGSLDRLFNARHVAVVGASPDSSKLGHITLRSILDGGFSGDLYPVNPRGGEILGLPAYRSLLDIPGTLDLVVLVVPAERTARLLEEAADKGAAGAFILSAGFREAGRDDLEDQIRAIARTRGLRLVGPNIQGVSYLPNKLCAVFWPVVRRLGPLGIVGQSGTVTAALADWAEGEGLGLSSVVNLGNQTDVCESDVLEFLSEDGVTGAIALHLEGLRDGRRFLEVAAAATMRTRVAVLKAGWSSGGQRAAASHTAALAGRDGVFSGACRQHGLVRADDLESLYDSAKALALLDLPRGRRLLVVSTSGGAGTLAADAAERRGLVLPPLPESMVAELVELGLPPNCSMSNPLDLASLDRDHFAAAIALAYRSEPFDMILAAIGDPVEWVEESAELLRGVQNTTAVAFLGGGEVEAKARVTLQSDGVPVFPTPERAVGALGATVWLAEFRRSRVEREAE
ncbi:MAG: CoA-binding protein [Thermoleophilia bacterium]|nr:CoA-binding protein [Thermoleophilia bacterium]